MSHLIIRKRTESLRTKLHSQQSANLAPRHSIGRILNDNISKRRFTTSNSLDHSADASLMQAEIGQAKQLFETKNTKSALLAFKKLSKKYPKNSEIPYYIGSCFLNEGSFEQALLHFRACLMLDANFNKNVYIFMSISLKAQGKLKQAIQILEQASSKYPRFKDALFYKGKLHLRLSQHNNASSCFRKCLKIDPGDNQSKLLLADSLAGSLNFEAALQLYNQIIRESQKHRARAKSRRVSILVQLKRFKEASEQLKSLSNYSAELTFLKGICDYELGSYNEAITCFELTLTSNIAESSIKRALKYLIQIRIKEKDFFGAEHLISRAKFVANGQEELSQYYKLVEGINDLIKKRLAQCEQKLQFVYNSSKKQTTDSAKFLYEACITYLAFCLFAMEKYEKSLELYQVLGRIGQPQNKLDLYNINICLGLVLHKRGQYAPAESKFREAAHIIVNKAEPLFLICVNAVQQNKERLAEAEIKATVIAKLEKQFNYSEQINLKSSLFLFYQSLVLLYVGKDATAVIDQAIRTSEEEVSEYFFIQALSYSLAGQVIKGLQSISKAIELDQSIPEFFKERSKYYYVLERYDQAVSDVVRILPETQDEESKLLLTFYYYMVSEYGLSFDLLEDISQQCSEDKFKEFQMALYFRLHRYDRCGEVGRIIAAIINREQLSQKEIANFVEQYINQRVTYSQFTVYFYHIILAAYYFHLQHFDSCLEHLFGALEEIQIASESEECFAVISETLLNQIKFNIALASLQKETQQKDTLSDSNKYIEMFIAQTEDPELISTMSLVLKLLQQPHNSRTVDIELFAAVPKLSDDLPTTYIAISPEIKIKTKFVIVYPQKLKFNISPEFDESFLFNFDIDKIESKLCPPWFRLHQGQVSFTDKIRNESVMISETDKAPTPALGTPSTPIVRNLKEKFKLDEQIEKKLQKIIRKNEERAHDR